ncbi:MAG: ABC transporter permease [Bacteroidetes bacterium]|nr:MAG: ABC transporter permease [Bacteroidota bacterium]
MEAAPDIHILRLLAGFGLLLIPVGLSLLVRLGIIGQLMISVGRMTGQLFLMSIVLIYLFRWDNPLINIAWVIVMIFFACLSAMVNSKLSFRSFFVPVFLAYFVGAGFVLLFFNKIIVNHENIFTARLLVVIGGMLLGNSLNSAIIGISHYYESIRKDNKRYLYLLSLGATQNEALLPFFRDAMLAALKPFMANMATMGLVSLPGMMTGQILGGAAPETAIKYQIAILLAIFTAVTISVSLSIYFTSRRAFNAYGVLKKDFFKS